MLSRAALNLLFVQNQIVERHSQRKATLKRICEFTMEKNHLSATLKIVTERLLPMDI